MISVKAMMPALHLNMALSGFSYKLSSEYEKISVNYTVISGNTVLLTTWKIKKLSFKCIINIV